MFSVFFCIIIHSLAFRFFFQTLCYLWMSSSLFFFIIYFFYHTFVQFLMALLLDVIVEGYQLKTLIYVKLSSRFFKAKFFYYYGQCPSVRSPYKTVSSFRLVLRNLGILKLSYRFTTLRDYS